MSKLRIGAVNYINTLPLIYRLAEDNPDTDVVLAVPSRLGTMLETGALDVALIPSIEYFRGDGYTIVPDACIGSRAEVLSVRLFSRVPIDEIQTLAVDEGSRTSVALTRILLQKRYEFPPPQIETFALNDTLENLRADAVLLIGDRCMRVNDDMFITDIDLGAAWTQWTGLPFVWAVWTARPGIDLAALPSALNAARDRGVAAVEEIATEAAARKGLPERLVLDYLTRNLCFTLGDDERRGLETYYAHATALNLAPEGRKLEYYRSQHDFAESR